MNTSLPFEKHTKMLLGMKRYREALLICLKWVEAQPQNANAWFFKAFAETNAHQPNTALESIDEALKLKPGNLLMLAQRAQILGIIGHSRECREALEHLLSAEKLPRSLLHQIGTTYNNIGEHTKAVSLFEEVRQTTPDDANNLVSLGTAYHILGRSEEAREAQRKALALDPDNFRAYWLLGQMRRATAADNEVDYFQATLEKHADKLQARVCLNFALAKQYEELEHFDEAFQCIEQGSTAVLQHTPYEEDRDRKLHDTILSAFDENFCSTPTNGYNSQEPIFILGMPRTGTTLLEQILTTYEDIETAGELHHFGHLLNQACVTLAPEADTHALYAAATQLDWHALGKAYLTAARHHVGDSPRFIDKYPLNFLFVGPILQALPNARIINLQRNPMDTCFSNYKLLYRLGSALHTYDLQTMARYYYRYRAIMDHWHNCLPGRVLDVSYESLVTDPVAETRRVAEFLDLQWRPECLEFYRAGGAVATASTTQVRNPINTGSLNKWRKFSTHLAPLADFFQDNGWAVQ